jgi:ABC-type nickel/cobalt efflux system permease component RcnA
VCVLSALSVLMFMSWPPILEMCICATYNRGEGDIEERATFLVCAFSLALLCARLYTHTLNTHTTTHTSTHTHTQAHTHTHTHTDTHTHTTHGTFFFLRAGCKQRGTRACGAASGASAFKSLLALNLFEHF